MFILKNIKKIKSADLAFLILEKLSFFPKVLGDWENKHFEFQPKFASISE